MRTWGRLGTSLKPRWQQASYNVCVFEAIQRNLCRALYYQFCYNSLCNSEQHENSSVFQFGNTMVTGVSFVNPP